MVMPRRLLTLRCIYVRVGVGNQDFGFHRHLAWWRWYARFDAKSIALMVVRVEVDNIDIRTPELPLFGDGATRTAASIPAQRTHYHHGCAEPE